MNKLPPPPSCADDSVACVKSVKGNLTAASKGQPRFNISPALGLILLLSALAILCELAYGGIKHCYDTESYISAWTVIKGGAVDPFRTPVYPLAYGICDTLFGPWAEYALVVTQIIVYLCSVVCFSRLSYSLTSNVRLTNVFSGIYALVPAFWCFTTVLMTESFAISGTVILLWLLVRAYRKPTFVRLALVALLLELLVFLRPAMLYSLVALGMVSVAWLPSKHRRMACGVLGSVAVILCSLHLYCKAVEARLGYYAVSSVSVFNERVLFISEDFAKDVTIADADIKRVMDEYSGTGLRYLNDPDLNEKEDAISYKRWHNELNNAKRQLGVRWYWHAIMRAYETSCSRLFEASAFESVPSAWNVVELLIPVRLGDCHSILIIYAVLLAYMFVKRRKTHWLSWLMLLMCLGNIAVMSIGSFGEWMRLFMPSAPLVLLITAHILSALKLRLKALTPEP